jgi:LPXTG-motif cell wall-anchored protein
MCRKYFFVTTLILTVSLIAIKNAYAQVNVVIPSFPACSNPQGETRVAYTTGIHGIPGDTAEHTGSDAVYNLTEETLTQCLCSENGDGIQTNWWKVSSLTFDEVQYLQALGWIYIPNGADWGLQEAPYMAQNVQYNCGEKGPQDKTVSDRDKNRKNKGGRGGPGEILAASTAYGVGGQILGLASTGNMGTLLVAFGTGALAVTSAVIVLKKKNEN